jgi:gluconokinase
MVDGLVYFGRMLDKIRLEKLGQLPPDYQENLGQGFDQACCDFLGVSYPALRERVNQGGTDSEILAWSGKQGKTRDAEERKIWNAYLGKRGWRDEMSDRLVFRKKEAGWEGREEIQTFFDYIDTDEGRG